MPEFKMLDPHRFAIVGKTHFADVIYCSGAAFRFGYVNMMLKPIALLNARAYDGPVAVQETREGAVNDAISPFRAVELGFAFYEAALSRLRTAA